MEVQMQSINIVFLHPTNGSTLEAEMDVSLTADDIINELIACNFIPDDLGKGYYRLLIKDTLTEIGGMQKIDIQGDKSNLTIRVLLATCAGGGEYLLGLWQSVYPYLDQIGTALGIIGTTVSFGVWIKNKFGYYYEPKQFVEKITDKEFWNAHELALKLNITNEEAKNLLKGFGYKWDNHFSLYYKTDKTIEILEKIQKEDF